MANSINHISFGFLNYSGTEQFFNDSEREQFMEIMHCDEWKKNRAKLQADVQYKFEFNIVAFGKSSFFQIRSVCGKKLLTFSIDESFLYCDGFEKFQVSMDNIQLPFQIRFCFSKNNFISLIQVLSMGYEILTCRCKTIPYDLLTFKIGKKKTSPKKTCIIWKSFSKEIL